MSNLEVISKAVSEAGEKMPEIFGENTSFESKVQSIVSKYSNTEFDWASEIIQDGQKRKGIDLRAAGNFYKYFNGSELVTLLERPDLIPRCLIRFIRQYPELYALACKAIEKTFRVERSYLKGTSTREEYNQSFDLRQEITTVLYPFIGELIDISDREFK